MKFQGTILGFNYSYECDTEEEFKAYLKAKLQRYVFKSHSGFGATQVDVSDVLQELLGVKELADRVSVVEAKQA